MVLPLCHVMFRTVHVESVRKSSIAGDGMDMDGLGTLGPGFFCQRSVGWCRRRRSCPWKRITKREKRKALSFLNSTRKNTYILYYTILYYSYCRLTREREREVHNQHRQQCAVRYGSWVADGGNGTRTVRTTSRTVFQPQLSRSHPSHSPSIILIL